MAVIHIPVVLRSYVGGQAEVTVRGKTVGAAFEDLLIQFPAMRPHLTNGEGKPRPFVNLFLGENNAKDLQGLDTPIGEDAKILLVPSIAGG
jgi:molybdopterin synthase sulfur carrier subunit